MLCRQLLGRRLIVGEVVNQRCGYHCWVIVAVVVVPGFDGFEIHVGKDFIEVNYEVESARITDGKVDFS